MTAPEEQEKPLLALGHGYTYIALEGTLIDAIGNQCQDVDAEFVANRHNRDGGSHSHMTLIHPKEITKAFEAAGIEVHKKRKSRALRALIAWILDKVGEPSTWTDLPIDLGRGHVRNEESEAYYNVLHWSMGEHIRRQLGLEPAFFHVTIGFHPTDVHGLYKGPGTLLILRQQRIERDQLVKLIQIAPLYTSDTVFIKALATHCVKGHLSIDWSLVQGEEDPRFGSYAFLAKLLLELGQPTV
ncbi:hypothetical protein BJV82DRAFT_607072 [Fennellomyces sp. T-0311]|nr:hypothetical protein BJV82DRAFT_607072 [Fennellomyces sp. T-0311]